MRVLVTGANGFIGRHLSAALMGAGHDPVELDRTRADINDLDSLLALSTPADTLVHLAFPASPGFRREHPLKALQTAAAGTTNVMLLANSCGVKHVVLASSGKIYGTPKKLPIAEDHLLEPTTLLGRLKLIQEKIVATAVAGTSMSATSLRLFNVYGAGGSREFFVPTLIAGFCEGGPLCLGELDRRRDWIHIDDVCSAFKISLSKPPPPESFRPLNVGSGRSTSPGELVEMLSAITGKHPDISQDPRLMRPNEPWEERTTYARLAALGWSPEYGIEIGLKQCWDAH
ncbi:MAG TPA: NAD(P)-dependent oxidoreductase [Myxococcota bacterium]|nr:NAD(P)-dependent oxidoreductase [Myxococcota bacterium]